jgi:sugar phosphate isomerase/epimerase
MIGLGSYAYYWRHRDGMTLDDALRDTAELGVGLFQICDFPAIEDADLTAVRSLADALGIRLELGTRGTEPGHLRRYLGIAEKLGARVLRSMVDSPHAAADLDAVSADLDRAGVALALETYEQLPTAELVALVADRPRVGICLDPGNTISLLEHPASVIALAGAHAVNVHVKDFAFSRADGWVGFALSGAPLGTGLLPLDELLAATPGSNRIVEHWLPWQGDAVSTSALERDWTRRSIDVLREKES